MGGRESHERFLLQNGGPLRCRPKAVNDPRDLVLHNFDLTVTGINIRRSREMNDDTIKKSQQDLIQLTINRNVELRKNLDRLQDSLDCLRLITKYLLFDLEATRRENAYLRKLIEEKEL